MRNCAIVLLVMVALSSAACSRRMTVGNVQPFDRRVSLEYPPSAGHVDVRVSCGEYSWQLPVAHYAIDYTVSLDGDNLLWKLTSEAQLHEFKNGKWAPVLLFNDLFPFDPKEGMVPKMTVSVTTDPLGHVVYSNGSDPVEAGQQVDENFWKRYYEEFFGMIFVPFIRDFGTTGTIVSNEKCMVPMGFKKHFLAPDVVLTGEKKVQGAPCIVLEYKMNSEEYKNRIRQKTIDTADVFMFLDQGTKVLRKARCVLKIKDYFFFVDAEYSSVTR